MIATSQIPVLIPPPAATAAEKFATSGRAIPTRQIVAPSVFFRSTPLAMMAKSLTVAKDG